MKIIPLLEYLKKVKQQRIDKQILKEDLQMLAEMSNLRQDETGLPFVIFVNTGGLTSKHAARIKVSPGIHWQKGNNASIQIEGIPRIIGDSNLTQDEFAQIMAWVQLNYDTIIKYWYGQISTKQMANAIIPYTE